MANAKYPLGKEGIIDRTIDLTGDIRAMLVKSTYTYDDTDKFLADLGAVDNGRSTSLLSKTYSLGVFNAANISLTATAAVACNAVVVFLHTGADATARIICYDDTVVSGLPFTPASGQTVNITWDTGANKIMSF